MIRFWEDWAEVTGFFLLVIGFFMAITAGSAVISYFIIILSGLMGGRIWYRIKENLKTPWIIILFGFLVGFVSGSFYGNKKIIILLYVVGIFLSYWLHREGWVKSLEY